MSDFDALFFLYAWELFWSGVLILIAIGRLSTDKFDPIHTALEFVTPYPVLFVLGGILILVVVD